MSDGSLKKFSIRMAYSELHDGGNVVRWSKLIWFSQNIPKHAFLLWLAIQCKLPTQDKIRRWGNYDLMDKRSMFKLYMWNGYGIEYGQKNAFNGLQVWFKP
ncbi:RNA-directed DNA polymerase, eukaryota, Reverse transcriptase zinc-binding domain protein [Artemisia annua]|uniref:RNA-directed DNA polymerase, eukaryota, Reverse transcriptase zinc-binding domain protein n=1 Tax=Artemisia annua TaxID=35608 RepID=A0A2U1PV82_ARTAN|nr:RNA-directed DNA polymerase, eukaryota, Reverse transcriptase zinc-binding domain protein [Artemisia annua]